MIKIWLFLLLFVFIGIFGIHADQVQPVATITEMEGKVEIKKGEEWTSALPLMPLYPGEIIRVAAGGKAVVIYLGLSTEVISEAKSPYAITDRTVREGRTSKVWKRMMRTLMGLFRKEELKTVPLITRGVITKINIILPPRKTLILFPKDTVSFEWGGGKPPYHVDVFKDTAGRRQKILGREILDIRLSVAGEIFQEKLTYDWTVRSEGKEESGKFVFLERHESEVVLADLLEILGEIPEENGITRAIIKYSYLTELGLNYDASLSLQEALEAFPSNETLKKLAIDN